MTQKILIGLVSLSVIYILTYTAVRQTHIEVWEKDKNAYAIFPEDKFLYHMYRPVSLLDGKPTGMRFQVGPHQ